MENHSQFDSCPDRRGTSCRKWDSVGEDVIPSFIADMDFRSPQCIIDALVERAKHGVFGYTFVGDDFFDAFCAWAKKIHHCDITKDNILLSTGVITAMQWSMNALDPEGGTMFIVPAYPPFWAVPRNLKKNQYSVPLDNSTGEWVLDFDLFEKTAAKKDVNSFILCNPHNPSGRIWTRDELIKMFTICNKYGVTVYADEIHGDIIMPGETYTSVLELPEELAGNAVVLAAPSKTFNLPGFHTSMIITRNADNRQKIMMKMVEGRLADPNIMGITAATAGYKDGEDWLNEMNAYVNENFSYIEEFLKKEMPAIGFIRPQSTYLAWLDCRKLGLDCAEMNKRLEAAGVKLGLGTVFGEEYGQGYMRLTAACPKKILIETMNRVKKAFTL